MDQRHQKIFEIFPSMTLHATGCSRNLEINQASAAGHFLPAPERCWGPQGGHGPKTLRCSGCAAPILATLLAQLVAQILALFGAELARTPRYTRAVFFPRRGGLLANQRPKLVPVHARLAFAGVGGFSPWPMPWRAPLLRPSAGAKPCPNEHPH